MNHDLVVYQFSRSKVESVDFSHFLSLYGPAKLPRGRRLREMMNTLAFVIEGFEDDPREVHCIPEVRRFYAAFHEAWPYWLYFCNLDTEELQVMALCCLPSISALKVEQWSKVSVEYDPGELVHLLGRDFTHMNTMCERAEMFEHLIHERTKAVFEYFKLPFDAPISE